MNTALQEHIKQAIFAVEEEGIILPLVLEKFAELIVRECADRVDWILAEGGKTQGDLIKQHFGVRE